LFANDEVIKRCKRIGQSSQQTSSRHHCGFQIVKTSARLVTEYQVFFSNEEKSKMWTRCDSA